MEVEMTETKKPAEIITPAVPTAPVPAPTADEIEAQKKKAFEAMGWGEPPKPATPAVASALAPAEPATPAITTIPAVVEPVTEEPTTEEIIRRTATATAEAMRPAAAEPAPSTGFKMNDDDAADYKVLLYLEQSEPSKWAGKAQQFVDYVKKHYAYMEEWEKNHAGESYDPDAHEHSVWYESNQPEIDPDDVKNGRIEMKATSKAIESVSPELNRMRSDRAIQENSPAIKANTQRVILSMLEKVDPEIGKLFTGSDGKPAFTKEAVDQLDQRDPVARVIVERIIKTELEPLVIDLEASVIPEIGLKLNPQVNQKHAVIDSFRRQSEDDLMAAPPEVRNQNGREFCTIAKMAGLQKDINDGSPSGSEKAKKFKELNDKYWTLSIDDLQAVMVHHYSEKAKKEIESFDNLAKRKFKPSSAVEQPPKNELPAPPTPPAPIVQQTPVNRNGKPNSPSTSSGGEIAPVIAAGNIPAKSFAEKATEKHFG